MMQAFPKCVAIARESIRNACAERKEEDEIYDEEDDANGVKPSE
jgi:hypothetical protein